VGQKGRKDKKGKKGPTQAERADRHVLYEQSVQAPEADIEFFIERYRERNRRMPRVVREDFCGTARLCRLWVEGGPRREAWGVDLDPDVLAWAEAHNRVPLGKAAGRMHLVQADVRVVDVPPADVVCAMNFSYCVFKERSVLKAYFERIRQGLNPGGLLVMEIYGGTEAIIACEETREGEGFTYHWDQAAFNPLTAETLCHIHYSFPDGSRIDEAFTYDWRLWSVPELRDLLLEAGFERMRVFWEQTDEDGDGTGEFLETTEEENQETYLVYLVAEA
jgi:SAM-dependent methyltransferase